MRGAVIVAFAVALLVGGGAAARTGFGSRETAPEKRYAGGGGPGPPPSTCSGVFSGAARGVFRCRVTAIHRAATQRSKLTIDIDQNSEVAGDALKHIPGGLEWTGEIAPGVHALADASVTSAWSFLETGLPDWPFDYIAAKAWSSYPVEQGEVAVTLTQALPGPVANGAQSYEVHGTFSARLLPYPAAGAASGMVRVRASF